MLRKFITALIVSTTANLVLSLGNIDALWHPHLWVLILIGVTAQMLQPTYKPIDTSAPPQDRSTATQIVWSVFITQVAGVIEAVYFRYPESFRWDAVSTAGVVLAAVGLAFRTWSISELGRFFTWHIMVQPGQQVVKTGPYRIVRHPGYSGALLMYVATMLIIHAWVTAAVTPFVLLFAFWRRIRHEEDWLRRHLGTEYEVYSGEVKALIPFIW